MERACASFGARDVHSFYGNVSARRKRKSDCGIRKLDVEAISQLIARGRDQSDIKQSARQQAEQVPNGIVAGKPSWLVCVISGERVEQLLLLQVYGRRRVI